MNYAERPFCINRTFFALTCEIAFESLNTALLRAKRAVFGGTVNANNGDGREATRAIHLTVSMMIYSVPRVLSPLYLLGFNALTSGSVAYSTERFANNSASDNESPLSGGRQGWRLCAVHFTLDACT